METETEASPLFPNGFVVKREADPSHKILPYLLPFGKREADKATPYWLPLFSTIVKIEREPYPPASRKREAETGSTFPNKTSWLSVRYINPFFGHRLNSRNRDAKADADPHLLDGINMTNGFPVRFAPWGYY